MTCDGLKPDPKKIDTVCKFPAPKDKQELLRFLGMINYLAKFIPNMSEINEPLRRLLEKDSEFIWGPAQEKCFRKLKCMICESPILRFYDVNKPITLTVDSSGFPVGACILPCCI